MLYHDAAPVRAALNGRVLLLDGVEKAERNVLPTINNLLENREMALPDGRFLVAPARFDELAARQGGSQALEAEDLVRVHEDFCVIAIGLPVPTFPGYPLDPPLRSRFQGRFVDSLGVEEQLRRLGLLLPGDTPVALAQAIAVFGDTFRRLSGMRQFRSAISSSRSPAIHFTRNRCNVSTAHLRRLAVVAGALCQSLRCSADVRLPMLGTQLTWSSSCQGLDCWLQIHVLSAGWG